MLQRTAMMVAVGLLLAAGGFANDQATQDAERAARLAQLEQRKEIQRLRQLAGGRDVEQSLEAMAELEKLGEPARDDLIRVLQSAMDKTEREAGRYMKKAGSLDHTAKIEEKLKAERDAAWENLGQLHKGEPVTLAHQHYDALKQLYTTLAPMYEVRVRIAELLMLRAKYVPMWERVAPADEKSKWSQDQDQFAEQVKDTLGLSVDDAMDAVDFQRYPAASDPAAWSLWHYAACEQIDAYNKEHMRQFMDRGEWDNAEMVNAYRRWLGVLPYELDERLIQSARRHSKEMVDKNYFSHTSPTPGKETFSQRTANAGYDQGSAENIAAGSASGRDTFWQWFDSPGHHVNMTRPSGVALGVGRWSTTWTQNMGAGVRLMLMTDAERAQIKVKGDILKP